jgi:hypothetical protein
MKNKTNIVSLLLLALGLTAFLVAVEQAAHRVDQKKKLERCLEEYGEGDLGMEMCYEYGNNN